MVSARCVDGWVAVAVTVGSSLNSCVGDQFRYGATSPLAVRGSYFPRQSPALEADGGSGGRERKNSLNGSVSPVICDVHLPPRPRLCETRQPDPRVI